MAYGHNVRGHVPQAAQRRSRVRSCRIVITADDNDAAMRQRVIA